jgi:predicted O-methyltransferase YrrM
MISSKDYNARGWEVLSSFSTYDRSTHGILAEIDSHVQSAGKSSIGTRNILHAFALSMKPKIVLEIGAHIGASSLSIGAALKANRFGTLYCLEPQEHYFRLLAQFIERAEMSHCIKPLQMLSTDPTLISIITEPVDMIYLDANHDYSSVINDLKLCDEMLADNGLLFLDDVGAGHSASICSEGRGGVRQALIEFTAARTNYRVMFLEHPFWLNPCGLAIVCKQRVE